MSGETSAHCTVASTTSVGDWLRNLEPPPPEALRARIFELVEPFSSQSVSMVPDLFLDAGERLLHKLLRSGTTTRDAALELLAVDALVTYAFQAAASESWTLDERAAAAMRRIASSATSASTTSASTTASPAASQPVSD